MSLERCLIVKNVLATYRIDSKQIFSILILIWAYSSFWIIVYLIFSESGFILEGSEKSFSFDYLSRDLKTRILMMTIFVGGFFFPLLLVIVCYLLIWFFLRTNTIFLTYKIRNPKPDELSITIPFRISDSHEKSEKSKDSFKMPSFLKNFSKNSGNEKSIIRKILIRKEVRIAKSILLIVFLFSFSWMPYSLMTFLAQFGNEKNAKNIITPVSTIFTLLFAKLSCLYNPILYTLTNNNCKKFYRNLFMRKLLSQKSIK
jgi:r-opsin